MTKKGSDSGHWLLLIHQLPPKPDYFRVKIWRRLQAIGAVAIKNSVYVLPFNDEAMEDFQWLRREITAGGGEATVCRASFVDGMSDRQMEALFRPLADHGAASERLPGNGKAPMNKRGRTWVTRPDVHVDRIASAWLIRRFIDPRARLAFGEPKAGMVRFDMFDGDYTHEGDRCTFETLLKRFGLDKDSGLRAIGEMVHDLDCKDGKFERQETPGFERMIAGVVKRTAKDDARIARGAELLDTLYESFPAAQQRSRSN